MEKDIIDTFYTKGRKHCKYICSDCGKELISPYRYIVNKENPKCRSCSYTKHGDNKTGNTTRLYNIWSNMIQRCENKNNSSYFKYGKKGVKVCNEWKDYSNFKEWALQNNYTDELTIDRINSNGNYQSNNCQWITHFENSRKDGTRKSFGKNKHIKLSEKDVEEIILKCKNKESTHQEIANEYSVSRGHISKLYQKHKRNI